MRHCAIVTSLSLALGTLVPGAPAQCPTDYTQWFDDRPAAINGSNALMMTALTYFDPDGTGPQAPVFIAAFYRRSFDIITEAVTERSRIDRWDTATDTWAPLSGEFDGLVNCFCAFDEDGAGVNPPRLYIGGKFSALGLSGGAAVSCANIVRYNGSSFSAVQNGLNSEVHSMLVFDDDAGGPVAPKLYVGGDFNSSNGSVVQGGVSCGKLVRLTGAGLWENPPSGFDDRVLALCSFDEDGGGPQLPRLVAGGAFSSNGGDDNQRLVAVFNGSTWSPLSQGLDRMVAGLVGSGRRVFALAEFDEDGAGPQLPSLFVGGSIYQTRQGLASPLVIRWRRNLSTGVAEWVPVAAAPGLSYQSGYDSCTQFCSNTPFDGRRPRILCMLPFDGDGAGPGAPTLYLGGSFDGPDVAGLMKWTAADGAQWPLGDSGRDFHYAPGIADPPNTWSVHPTAATALIATPGNGSAPPTLHIGGGAMYQRAVNEYFQHWVTDVPRFQATAFSAGGVGPSVTNQPDNTWTTLTSNTSAGFGTALSGSFPFTYRWRHNGIDLNNGASQGWGNVIGATGAAVILGGNANPVNTDSQGWYDCRIGNACGTGYTTSAWLVVQPDATPYFPVRFDSPVAPVTTAIGNADMRSIFVGAPYPTFYTTVAGTPFAIAPTGNNAWRGRLASGSPTGNRSVTIPISRAGVGDVYTLLNTDGSSSTNVRLQFVASGGLVYTVTLTGGSSVRSYSRFYGPQTVTSANSVQVFDNGINRMDKQRIILPNAFRLATLTSLTITDLGTDSTGRAILAGLTLMQRPPACGASDVGGVGGAEGADGVLDNNDFVVFIDYFFNGDLRADVGSTGGVPGPDGVLDNNDVVVFIDRFFAGC